MTKEFNDKERLVLAVEAFRRLHVSYLGYPYAVSWGKDTRLMKEVLAVHKLETIVKLLKLFFGRLKTDKFTQTTGASIGVFRSQLPKLLMEIKDDIGDTNKGILDANALANS